MHRFFILLLSIIFSLPSCHSIKSVAKKYPIVEIQFGYGGGVTGLSDNYVLKATGELYKNETLLKVIPKEKFVEIFELANTVSGGLNKPGNTFKYIRIVKDTDVIYFCWEGFLVGELQNLDNLLYQIL